MRYTAPNVRPTKELAEIIASPHKKSNLLTRKNPLLRPDNMSAAYRNPPLRTENLLCPLFFRGGSFGVFSNLGGKSCRLRLDDKLPPELGLKLNQNRTFDRPGRLLVPLEAFSKDFFLTVFREQNGALKAVFFFVVSRST